MDGSSGEDEPWDGCEGVGRGVSFGGGREGLGIPVGGVRGEIDAGQNGKGLVGRSAGGVAGSHPLSLVFGKNLSCSADM